MTDLLGHRKLSTSTRIRKVNNMWYRIVVWLIHHSKAAMRYVIEMRNEVADQLLREMEKENDR